MKEDLDISFSQHFKRVSVPPSYYAKVRNLNMEELSYVPEVKIIKTWSFGCWAVGYTLGFLISTIIWKILL